MCKRHLQVIEVYSRPDFNVNATNVAEYLYKQLIISMFMHSWHKLTKINNSVTFWNFN